MFGGSGNADTGGDMTVVQGGTATDPNQVAAASAAQLANISAQAHTAEVNAATQVSLATIAAQTAQSQMAKDTAYHIADLTAAQQAKDSADKLYITRGTLNAAKVTAAQQERDRHVETMRLLTLKAQGKIK